MMKALLLNGAYEGDELLKSMHDFIHSKLKSYGWEVDSYILHEHEIKDCMGCFSCWLKTPGLCIYNDISKEISKKYINSDLFINLSPVQFGCYSYHSKKYLDKMIPNILPFFKKIEGEVHHVERYDRYPEYYMIGVIDEDDNGSEEIFEKLIMRNFINFNPDDYAHSIIYRDMSKHEINDKFEEKLSKWKVVI